MLPPGLCPPLLALGQDPFRGLTAAAGGARGGRTSPAQTRAARRWRGGALRLDVRLEHAHFLIHLHVLQLALQDSQLPLGLLWPWRGEGSAGHHLLPVPSRATRPSRASHAAAATAVQPAPATPPVPGAPGLLGRQRLGGGEEEGGASHGAENAAGAQAGPARRRRRLAAAGPGAAALRLVGATHDRQAVERVAGHGHSTGSAAARRLCSRPAAAVRSAPRGSWLSPGGPAAAARHADGRAWPWRGARDRTAGSAPAQSSINDSATVETQGDKSGPQRGRELPARGTPIRAWSGPRRGHSPGASVVSALRCTCAFPEGAPHPSPQVGMRFEGA